jgi:hypothetical protein
MAAKGTQAAERPRIHEMISCGIDVGAGTAQHETWKFSKTTEGRATAEILATPADKETTLREWKALAERAGLRWPPRGRKAERVEKVKAAAKEASR